MIFMIFGVCWGRIQELTWNFEHLVDVTWRGTCGKSVFKLYKIRTKSKNDKTCRGVVLSHVESMVKNWEGFEQVVTSDAWVCIHAANWIDIKRSRIDYQQNTQAINPCHPRLLWTVLGCKATPTVSDGSIQMVITAANARPFPHVYTPSTFLDCNPSPASTSPSLLPLFLCSLIVLWRFTFIFLYNAILTLGDPRPSSIPKKNLNL